MSFWACILWVVLGIMSCEQVYAADDQKVLVLTIPKAGTHLIMKAVESIVQDEFCPFGPTIIRQETINRLCYGRDRFFIDHLMPDYDFLKFDRSKKFVKVVFLRDPRDVVLSLVYWVEKMEMAFMSIEKIREFNQLPFDERLSRVILMPDANYGASWFVRNTLEWMKNPTVFVCRFEDLVGPKGGGSRKRQEKTIEALAIHLGYSLEPERVAEIADELFGGTWTFRNGQIGGWKEYFTPEHIELFKQVMGKELIELGYEVDNEW